MSNTSFPPPSADNQFPHLRKELQPAPQPRQLQTHGTESLPYTTKIL